MFFKKKTKDLSFDSNPGFSSLVANGVTFAGSLDFVGTLKVAGIVKGDRITGAGDATNLDQLFVAEGGVVESAEITAHNIVINGTVTSKVIRATGTVSIGPKASISSAVIYYSRLNVSQAAFIDRCELRNNAAVTAGDTEAQQSE